MKYEKFPPEFTSPWALCLKLFSKCYIHLFDKQYKEWRLYCTALLVVIHNITMWIFMSKIFTEKINIVEVAYMISVCDISIQAVMKAVIVLYRKSDIETLIKELASMWRTANLTREQIRIKKHLTKQLILHHTIFYWTIILGAWLHLTAPLIEVLFRGLFLSEDFKLTLPFGSTFPFDPTDNWIIYLGTYGFQTFSMLKIVYALVGAEFLMITFCGNLAIEFALLSEDLVHVAPFIEPDMRESSFEQREDIEKYSKISLKESVRRHQHLIRLSTQLDDVFNRMILMNLLCVTIIVCFFAFAFTVARGFVETANNFIAVIAMLIPLFLFCYYGELLKNESLGVADAAYNSSWYKGDVKFQRAVVLIIARSQRACCLTSWRQVPVTLNMFAKVSSTAWSYFSLVTSVYSSHEETNSG